MAFNHSASQVELVTRCARKAAFKYGSDYPKEPYTASTTLGTELHDAAELYSKTGTSPPDGTQVGQLFRAALPHVALPGHGVAEGRREVTIAGHKYTVLLDWYGRSTQLPDVSVKVDIPAVLDYKTSSNPQGYGVGFAKPVLSDPQVVLYSAFALVDSQADAVYGRWLYLHTKNKSKIAFPVDFCATKTEVEQAFGEQILPASNLLKKLKNEKPDPNTVAPNPMACNDYRKLCWYSEENGGPCRLTDQDRRDALARAMFTEREGEGSMPLRDLADKSKSEPVKEDPGINPPDVVEKVPEPEPEPEPEPTKKSTTKKSTTKKAPPLNGDDDLALAIGRGVLAAVKALKQ